MRTAFLLVLGSLSVAVPWPQPVADQDLAPQEMNDFEVNHGHWIIPRAETTAETTAEDTTATTAATTDAAQTTADATTTDAATTTSASTSETTTSQTTATTATTTTSSSSTSTTTASTTTSTATATSTASAALAERNHKGKIAAIVTFTILGSIFFGICIVSRVRKALAKKKKAAAAAGAIKKVPDSGSTYSMVPLTDETGRPTSAAPFDRTSIMFASPSQSDLRAYSTPRGSAYFDPNTGLVQDPSSSSSPARSRDAPSSSRSATPRGQPSPPR